MEQIFKYPRTRHLEGSGLQADDDPVVAPWADLVGRHLVVEEKVDGANCGVSFEGDGRLRLQSRGHYLTGGPRERQFDLLKGWAAAHAAGLWMEGLYIKLEAGGAVTGRYKYVRRGFLQTVLDSGSHWQDRPLLPNRLRAGAGLW